jgi:HSP20 family protein
MGGRGEKSGPRDRVLRQKRKFATTRHIASGWPARRWRAAPTCVQITNKSAFALESACNARTFSTNQAAHSIRPLSHPSFFEAAGTALAAVYSARLDQEQTMSNVYSVHDVARRFESVREQVDKMFRGMATTAGQPAALGGDVFPQLNLGATESAFEIVAVVPGIDASKLQVLLEKGVLTISGERAAAGAESAEQARTVYAQERSSGKFRRAVELPQDADPEQVTARYQDGCLHVSIKKRESAKARLIEVQ